MKKTLKIIGKVLSVTVTVLLVIILICNVYVLIARKVGGELQPDVFGWSWAVVISGSMKPSIMVDDLVVVHRQKDYNVRDVISFESGSSVVTHRIIEKGDGEFITKGDANNTPDSAPVKEERVIGKVVLIVPAAGKVIKFFQEPLGISLMVFAGLLIIELPFLIQKFKKTAEPSGSDEKSDEKSDENNDTNDEKEGA